MVAMADSGASYTLGYYPQDKKWDGKYRSIKVKVNRDGVEARYRRGYFAIDPTSLKDRNPEQGAAEALQDSAPDTLVTFSAQVKPAGADKLGVDFLVDAHTLSTEDVSGGNKKFNVVLYTAIFTRRMARCWEAKASRWTRRSMLRTYQQILSQRYAAAHGPEPAAGQKPVANGDPGQPHRPHGEPERSALAAREGRIPAADIAFDRSAECRNDACCCFTASGGLFFGSSGRILITGTVV